jgi:hypothetical protein
MRKVLERQAKQYHPPESGDPAALFADALGGRGMDLFLNGA